MLVLFLFYVRGWRRVGSVFYNTNLCFDNRLSSPRCFSRSINFPLDNDLRRQLQRPRAEVQAPIQGEGVETANWVFSMTCDGDQECFIVHVYKAFRK